MALTDAQAKIIAANKKKREEEQKIAAAAAAKILASSTTKKSPSTILDQRVSSLSGNGLKTPLNYLQEAAAQKITTQDRISAAKRSGAVRGDYQSQWQKNKATAAERLADRRERNSKQTLSEYDSKLDRTAQDRIRDYKTQWDISDAAGNTVGKQKAHALAEQVRARAGYSGGVTGDEFLTADLTDREKLTLNQVGQNKLKMAKLAQKQAFEAKDAKALQEATAEMARIMNAPGYRNKAAVGDTDAHGRSKLPGSPDAQREGERAMAGLKAVGYGIPGSIGALGQVAGQAATNNVVDSNREYMQDLANRKHEFQAKIDAYENGEYIPPDWEPLGQLKSLLRAAENAERMLESGAVVDPDNWAYDLMRQSNEYAEEFLRGRTGLDRLLAETAMSMGQNLPGIALGLLPIPGAQAAGLGLMAAQAAGSRAYDLEMNGVDASTALIRGLGSGAVEGLTEKIPLDNLAKILKGEGGENVLRTVLTQMGMEGTEEGVAYVANFLLDKIAQDPNAEWSWEELGRNALMGALAGGAFATGGTIAADALGRRQTVQPTETEVRETAPATPAATQGEEADRILRQTAEAMLSETTQETAGEPVAASLPQAATVAEEQGEVQQKRTREAPTAVAESATTEQVKPAVEKVEPRRIESIPVPVETVQTVRAEEPATLAAKASTLGENGQKALKAARPAQGVAQYTSDFIRVYNQAFTGTSTSRIQAPSSMTDDQVIAAYNSGIRDREASLASAREAAKYATVAGKDSGLVYDDYVQTEMDTTVASEINDLSKQLGLRVSMVDAVAGGSANAEIQGSVVRIEKGNPNPVRFLFGHEMTHRVQELAPEAYRAFRDFVMQDGRYQAAVNQKVEEYARQGVELTQEAAMDEIAADYAGALIQDKQLMSRFIESNRKNTSLLGRVLTALKDMAAKLTGKYKTQVNDAVALLEKAVNEAAVRAKKLERRGKTSQVGMVYDDGNGHSRYSLKTYREGGRQTLSNWLDGRVKNGDLSREDARDMLKEMDRIYDVCNKYTDVYAPFGKWSEAEVVRDENGDAVFSVVKANGDYPMNMDFSLVCKKRRPLDAVLNSLVEQGLAEKFALNKQSIVVLNDIIRRHGFETACSLCFVDAKRFRVTEVADQFATMYNKLVRSMIPKGKDYRVASFNFGGDKTVKKVSGGIDTMKDSDLNFKEIEKTIRTTGEKSVAHKIAVHLRDNPADRKLVRRGDFISTAGFDRVKKDNPALLSLYNSKKGSAGPKASFSDVQYLSEVLEQRVFKRDAAYAVGGVRIQSFSDYMPRLFFDYAQMIADLAAKKLPAHAYSKEAMFVQQFGQTGTKINMSLVPKVVKGGVAPGLDANGDYAWQEGQTFGSAVSDKDNGKAGFDLAVQIQNAEGYGDNCGTIAVGVSDRHIEKMLDDPDIRMIIPYHKSGLNPVVAAMNKIDSFENYTNDQNTRHKGTKKKVENAHFDFNAEFHSLGDAKAAADAYLAWCQEKNYLPKFDKWAGHPNYYKLLIDFSAYNSKGEATPQGDVRIQYPQEGDAFGSLNDLIKQGLEEDALAQAALDKGVQPILDDIAKELPAREAEWANSGKRYSMKTDDQGRSLTAQQAEFFSDSRVADGDGNLLTVYHGTKNPGFTQFDTWEGAWVSPNREYAEAYAAEGNQPYELYANVTKPADLGELNVPLDEEVGRRLAEAIGVSYSAIRKDVSRLSGQFAYELTKGRYFVKLARQKGFDGFKATEAGVETWAVFSPEQLKEVGNTNPTGSGDIRYSLKSDSNETRINSLRAEISDLESRIEEAEFYEDAPADIKRLRNQLTKARGEYDKIIAQERKDARLTSMQEILNNLEDYRLSDLHSMAEQISDSNWDGYEDLSPAELRDALREAIEGRELSPLEMQSKKYGMYVRPPSRYSLKGADDYQGLIEKYGSIEPGEKRAREVQVPRQTADDKMVSRTVRTIMEAAVTTEEMLPTIEKLVEQGEFSYEVAGDKEAIAQAEAVIRDKGYQTALVDWTSDVSKGVVSKQNTATGWALYNAAVNAGDAKTAADVMSRIVYHQRNAAQAVQATRILKKMAPGAQLYAIQRSVQNMQSELVEKYGDKAPGLKIPDELVENFLTAETDEARLAAEEEIYRNIGKQMPSTFIDKWNAWRYLAMLGNFRTHIRNISGNLVFAPFVAAKNVVGVGLETAGSVVSGGKMQRTKGVATPSLLAAGWNDYQNAVDQIMAGGKYDDSTYKRDAIAEGRQIFRLKPLEFLRRLNSWALEKEDGWFAQPHYANALAQYCAANGITAEQIRTREGVDASALDKARAYAIKEAQKATYRDFNQFSDFIGTLGRYDGSNKVRKAFSAAVEGVLPFRKTPANILVRALEYSPVGLIQGAAQLAIGVPRKMNTAAEALDHLASGLTGTGLVAAGYFLAKMGLLTAGPDDDEEQAKFDDLTGKQDYSWMRKDGTNFTLDWLAPECIPLLVGADIFAAIAEETDSEEKRISAFLGAMSQITDPLLEMSCLSSLNELFDNLNQFSEDGIQAGPVVVANMVVSYLTQGIPTLLGQGERASEADRMTTYTDKNGELPTDWQYVIGRASARIPKWDYNQIPYIDAWGRTDREDSQGKRILDNFFNPAFSSTFSMDSVETELERLYGIVGEDSKVYPSRADRYFNVNGARVDLTADQYVEYAQRKGQRSYELVQSVVSSPWYASASDVVKGEVITNAYTIANEEAKKALFPEYESKSYVYLDAQEAVEAKIPVVDYLYARTLTSGVASLKDANGETITLTQDLQQAEALLNSGIDLSGEKRNAMFDIVGIGKTVKGYSASRIASELASKRSQAVEQ